MALKTLRCASDINECIEGEFPCHPTAAECNNTQGSYECDCNVGYHGDGKSCEGLFLSLFWCSHNGTGVILNHCEDWHIVVIDSCDQSGLMGQFTARKCVFVDWHAWAWITYNLAKKLLAATHAKVQACAC